MFGPPEIAVVFLIMVLLFGANKIPKLARAAGQAQGELKKGREEVEKEISTQKNDMSGNSVDSDETEIN